MKTIILITFLLTSHLATSQTSTIFNKKGDTILKDVPNHKIQKELKQLEEPNEIYFVEMTIDGECFEPWLYQWIYTTKVRLLTNDKN